VIVCTVGVLEAELAKEAATVGHEEASLFVAHVAFEFLQHGSLVGRVGPPALLSVSTLVSFASRWVPA
jgi:HEPN domain-containing protein